MSNTYILKKFNFLCFQNFFTFPSYLHQIPITDSSLVTQKHKSIPKLLKANIYPSNSSPIPPLAISHLLLPFFGAKKNSENQTLFYAICARFFSSFRLWFFGMMIREGSGEKGPKRDSLQQKFNFWTIFCFVSVPSLFLYLMHRHHPRRPFSCLGFVFLLFSLLRLFSTSILL